MSSMSFFSCRITTATLKRCLRTKKDTEVWTHRDTPRHTVLSTKLDPCKKTGSGHPLCFPMTNWLWSSCSDQTHQRGDEHPSQPSIVKCAALPWHVKFTTLTPPRLEYLEYVAKLFCVTLEFSLAIVNLFVAHYTPKKDE